MRRSTSRANDAEPPKFIEPCLAELRSSAPASTAYIHEIKFDGYRAQAHKQLDRQIIFTRRGYDWTARFQRVADAIATLPAKSVVLDGEIIVPDARGASDYHALQLDLAQGRSDRFVYFVFDLLYLNGEDLRALPLIERKARLTKLLAKSPDQVQLSQHFDATGPEVFERVCEMKLEGIVSKRRDGPYRSGRTDLWIKSKCLKSDTYPIIAFVEKLGASPRRVASLYVGRREEDELLYAGKLKTGYTDATARALRELLDPHIRKTAPLSTPIKKPKATWVEPVIDAEVEFSSITADGLLREAVFKGVREGADRAPSARVQRSSRSRGAVPKENILQLLPDAVVPTRQALAQYWQRVAKQALKYLARRPLKLVRHTKGTTFYHMGKLPPIPSSVHQLKIAKRAGGEGTRLWIDDLDGLLGLVEIGAVELHPWNALVDDIELADTLVFDFDPGTGVDYEFVVTSALAMRDLLKDAGLKSWPKLSGGKGIHVMAPLDEPMPHDQAHALAKHIAEQLARTAPRRYTLSAALEQRTGRLFIDYLRNGRGTTAVGAYSPRVRPGFPIARPVTWKQIEAQIEPNAFTMSRVHGGHSS